VTGKPPHGVVAVAAIAGRDRRCTWHREDMFTFLGECSVRGLKDEQGRVEVSVPLRSSASGLRTLTLFQGGMTGDVLRSAAEA
jgi:hypothetical protein